MPTLLMYVDGRVQKLEGYPQILEPIQIAACEATAKAFNLMNGVKDVGLIGPVVFDAGVNAPNIFFKGIASQEKSMRDPYPLIHRWESEMAEALDNLSRLDQCKDLLLAGPWRVEFQPTIAPGKWASYMVGLPPAK